MHMNITLNGASRILPPGTTITALLEMEDMTERRVAVEVNRSIVPRSAHASHTLKADDQVEIVHAIGGG